MTNTSPKSIRIALSGLVVLHAVMLMAMLARVEPHPPFSIAPFALGPFLGATIAVCVMAFQTGCDSRASVALTLLACALSLVSFGPHKWFDPSFSQIWPGVVAAQACVVAISWQFVTSHLPQTKRRNQQ